MSSNSSDEEGDLPLPTGPPKLPNRRDSDALYAYGFCDGPSPTGEPTGNLFAGEYLGYDGNIYEKFTNNFIEPHNYLVGSNLLQSYKNLGGCVTSFRKGEHQKLVSEYIKLGGDITQFNEDGSKKIKNMLFSMSHV